VARKVGTDELNEKLFSWWQVQLDISQLRESRQGGLFEYDSLKDPSLPENTYASFDGVAFDDVRKKTWIRCGLRSHIVWLEESGKDKGYLMNEFMPETIDGLLCQDFMEKPIPAAELLGDYLRHAWKENPFFKLPYVSVDRQCFGKITKSYSGILVSTLAKKICEKETLKEEFLNAWRINIFKGLNGFYEKFKYNPSHDYQGKARPSVQNGFIMPFERKTREELLEKIRGK